MTNQQILLGGGGLIVGVFVGLGIGGALVGDKIDAAVARSLQPLEETVQAASPTEALSALEGRIAALESQIADTAARSDEMTQEARAQFDAVQSALSERIDGVVEATGQQASDLRMAVSELFASLSAPQTAVSGAGDAVASDETPADLPAGETVAVGHTALFADGMVRAFVSRVDSDAARLSVNGEMASISVGQAVPVSLDAGDCAVVLQGVAEGGAILSSNCGAAGAMASGGVPEEGFRPGETAILADGALRVFISGLVGDGSAARIAVNGVETQLVAAGETVGAGACDVTVTGVGGGLVGLDGSCK